MRLEAERKRLSELEAQAEEMRAQLAAQAEAAQRDREELSAENARLKTALSAQNDAAAKRSASFAETMNALSQKVDAADRILTDPDRMRRAVAPILSGAVRDAGGDDPAQMSNAMAPYVVSTIKSEIRGSKDELIEAIHPHLGKLIASAVANAIDEINRKVDEALPIDRWIASAKGKLTGAPAAGWLLENGKAFAIRDAMLIDRHSGVLLANERIDTDQGSQAPDEDLMAGMIAALHGFASEAYGATGAGDLRRFSFTEDTVYLRGSPTKILALRCTGVAPPEIETRVDQLLLDTLERLNDAEGDANVLRLDALHIPPEPEGESVSASRILATGIGAIASLFALVWGNAAVREAHDTRWLESVRNIVEQSADLGPYPLEVNRGAEGSITIRGLLPDDAAMAALRGRLRQVPIPTEIEFDVALLKRENR